nr:CuZn-superoxide dismutase, CuZn-SOD {N-terminal} [Marchantia paleacea=liverworts, diptera, suspension-cultured cells, Peptide Partial, 22 aa] [Marchantia paleacea]
KKAVAVLKGNSPDVVGGVVLVQ